MELKFKGMLPLLSLTKKEYEENKEFYYSVEKIDNSPGVIYTTHGGAFLTHDMLIALVNSSASVKLQDEYDELKKNYDNLLIDYDVLNRKYQLAIQKIVEMEK